MRVPVLVTAALVTIGAAAAQEPMTATVTLKGKDGADHGAVTLTETLSGVLLRAELKGLPPGPHGFHFHEKGTCAPDFAAAGGHFNPDEGRHGYLSEEGPHAGDLPNLIVPESGNVTLDLINMMVALDPEAEGTLLDGDGTALIVHAGPDDYKSQPAGGAGEPIACGVVERR